MICQDLLDNNISDDANCAKIVYRAHFLSEGNGFKAFGVYNTHCSGDTSKYLEGCFV